MAKSTALRSTKGGDPHSGGIEKPVVEITESVYPQDAKHKIIMISRTQSLADYQDPPPPPDLDGGGLKAWLCVFGAFVSLLCVFGQMCAFGTFQNYYTHHQLKDLPPSAISWIGSLQLWIFFFSGGPIGRASDAYGPTPILAIGTAIAVSSNMMTSFSTRYYQYLICQGVLQGLGASMMFYPSLAAISTYFSKYRATALGIASIGLGLGGFMYPALLQRLFAKAGYGWTVRVCGLICLVGCLLALVTVTNRSTGTDKREPEPWIDTKALKDTRFTLLTLGSCLVSMGLYIPPFYIMEYCVDQAISPRVSFFVPSILNASSILGRLIPAVLSDLLGRFNLLFPSAFICGASCLCFWMSAHTGAEIALFAAVYGFWSGAYIGMLIPCVAQISEVKDVGRRVGMIYSIISVPALVSGPIAGTLLSHSHGFYTSMVALSGSMSVAGSLVILWSKLKVNPVLFACV